MAYSVDWIAKRVTIPLSDLTLVSGANYTLAAADVHNELRRLEWSPDAGLWAEHILEHYPTVTLSGIPKTRTIEMTNGYTWDIGASNIIVTITGIDHNLLDTFAPANGVSLLAFLSVGKQDVSSGSGLDAGQDAKLTNIDDLLSNIEGGMNHDQIMRLLLAAMANKLGGAGTTEVKIRDVADTKDRVIATVDEVGNRTSVIIDPD